jgi:hypothetical protein
MRNNNGREKYGLKCNANINWVVDDRRRSSVAGECNWREQTFWGTRMRFNIVSINIIFHFNRSIKN